MRRYQYSDEIAEVVKKFLEEDEWNYSFDDETGLFRFDLRIRSKIQKINYAIDVHKDEIVIYGISPVAADPDASECMVHMAEFICHTNYGIKNGCFEFDFEDGEIRFRRYIDCDNNMPSVEVVKNSVYCIAAMYKSYAQGFTDIIFGGASAIDAFRKCEKMTEDELRLALETALGDDLNDSSLRELLSHLEENLDVSADKENKTGEIEEKSEEPHINMNLFGTGGEA